ncbi:MAG: Gfo/Idh/MocA family oxidoreductase [Desulfobacterales bacterium]|nr:Gfo/Idh/MocA family oxidoreductase [Desulfobacterales bacterium]
MKKIRAAVIGVGYLGKFHAEKYAGMDNVDLVGVVDTDEAIVKETAAKLNTSPYTDYKQLIGNVDAVSIVVPTPAHAEVAMNCLENNIDVLIEKPITTTIEEADALIKKAEEKKLIIQVGHLERFNPAVVALKDIVKKPMFIESNRISIYKDRGTEVNVVLDLMIHDIDIISSFVQSNLDSIHASGTPVISSHVDIANARLEFDTGCVANVTASRISMKNERKIRLFQNDAYISVDFTTHDITIIRRDENITGGLIPGMDIQRMRFARADALDDELRSFIKSVETRERPVVTGKMGRDALKIALNIMTQIRDRLDREFDE